MRYTIHQCSKHTYSEGNQSVDFWVLPNHPNPILKSFMPLVWFLSYAYTLVIMVELYWRKVIACVEIGERQPPSKSANGLAR